MSGAEFPVFGTECSDARIKMAAPVAPPRFYGLDGVRATAMLLGVFYHLPISFMAGGFGMGFDFGGSPKSSIDNWLHSFRMPLFFLISGFFANMMLGKYGLKRYLARRWWRIGAPLFIALAAFAGLRMATDYFRSTAVPGFGPPGAMNTGFGPAPGPFVNGPAPAPFGGGGAVFGPPGPTFFGGPVGGIAGPGPTSNGGATNSPAPTPFGGTLGPFNRPAPVPFGGPGGAAFGPSGPVPFGGPIGGFGPAGAIPLGGLAGPVAVPPMPMPQVPSRSWADRLFKDYSRYFNLEHLWFLWYLLVFVTIAPIAAKLFSWISSPLSLDAIDRFGRGLIRFNVMAPALGLATLPALIHASGPMGWSLANPLGFLAPFPDFLFQYHADCPHYFMYFLVGWWFYRLRDGLPDLARAWLWNLVLGIAGFAISQYLSSAYVMRTEATGFEWIRLAGFALYGVGAAYTTCGFIGFFQRYLDRPTRLGRYFADTALWIYLVHLPLIPYLIWWIQPARTAWWGASFAGMVVVTGVALVLFELIVRPTPLVYVFGPPSSRRSGSR
jgi:peptidoglycan/LPS O-acetylase OafA/YrhL